ncbi:MAG: LysM peptidoglycan-binding domain-containing protein [Muribaculaceae bacterium]|nr:LysM peptidoglycan-binding domain-containing protein [Muribaculaceae bacterium]
MKHARILAFATLWACCLWAVAQTNLPTTTIGGMDFNYYELQSRDKLPAVAEKFGVDTDDLVEMNPWLANGVEKRLHVFMPVVSPQSATHVSAEQQVQNAFGQRSISIPSSSKGTHSYTLAEGDNLYTVAKQHGMTVEGLLSLNPRIRPEGYVPGQTVKVSPGSALPFAMERNTYKFILYKPGDSESFYTIARRYDITQEDLMAANPTITRPKKGKNMVVPQRHTTRALVEIAQVSADELQRYYAPRINDIYETLQLSRKSNEVNIALILPFQLHKPTPPTQALLYTDFYKGFLLAVDSINHTLNKHVNITVYDTQHNLNVTDSILALPQLDELDFIVAPSEPKQLERIINFGKEHNVNIMNCFTTKNEQYRDVPQVYQVNMPSENLASNVLHWFDNNFSDHHVIYLTDKSNDEKEIFDAIKSHIDAQQPSTTIRVDKELKFDDLSNVMNPGIKYVIIPSSADKDLLKNVVKAIKQVKDERFDCDLRLIGYPEYVLYLKDYQSDLQDIDTYLFSRFFNSKGVKTRDVESRYSQWFAGKPLTAVPNMTLFGFDTAMYLLGTLDRDGIIDDNTPLYRGIQTSFKFKRDNDMGGWVNDAIDIVHFTPAHTIETLVQ